MADQLTAQKLWCLDQVLRDVRATHLDFRLAYYVGSVTDRATGEARFKQITAATALHVTRRAIQLSADRLVALGHFDISFRPGRGHLNGYRLCLEKANVASPIDDENTNSASPFEVGKANVASPIQGIKGELPTPKRRTAAQEKANRHSHQSSLVSIPCLIPSVATAAKNAGAFAALGPSLGARLGADVFHAWFKTALITDVSHDSLTLELGTKFLSNYVATNFLSTVTEYCRAIQPTIERVKVVWPATARAPA
jgi:hypothetical protein